MIEQLPNITILKIIKEVNNNVDLICLLLTCKRLYYNIRQLYSSTLQFRHIKYRVFYHQWLVKSTKSFNLHSFKHLFNNALSNQIVVFDDDVDDPYKQSLNSHLINNNNNDNNLTPPPDNISIHLSIHMLSDIIVPLPSTTTSIDITSKIDTPLPSTLLQGIENLGHLSISDYTSPQRLCKLPDTLKSFELYYTWPSCIEGDDVFPLGLETLSISSLNGYEGDRVPITLSSFGLEKLKSLKSLELAPVVITEFPHLPPPPSSSSSSCFLPISLTSLDIVFECTVPSNFFQSLVSLESITMRLEEDDDDDYDQTPKVTTLDLTNLYVLNSLKLFPSRLFDASLIKLPLSSSLKTLYVSKLTNLSTQFFPTTLTSLDMNCAQIDYETIELPNSLIELTLVKYQDEDPIPVGFIPSSVKTLLIPSHERDLEIIPLSIPSSVETLTLYGYDGPTTSEYLPDSIKELVWNRETDTQTLPSKLETLYCRYIYISVNPIYHSCVFPSTIQHIEYPGIITFPLPPSLTSLSCEINSTYLVDNSYYSISKFNYKQQQQQQDNLLLPLNLRKLKMETRDISGKFSFRLDQVINQTNIEKLTFTFYRGILFKATIKRLDKDNSRVLIVDNKSLFGGIISQSRQSNNNEYAPIYLHIRKENNNNNNNIPSWSHTLGN
ncbi:hypothetical protein DFA_00892 [Cavenderia fasciculata]|uniref:Uncharacterized protein n=1 Tax=Cavenderia fasciculata TaxID=261658 RepID=F4PUF1_CACFS|nr:uncharacterized protein DFA_00892 [Cavenderia fasciculata]EGG21023.1 hypothetical protein DFA_00892 [Cavenderia fasciculata]|eukprot:XP_004358873.1 hypothetical protein DFA_00892 [Cavenderia fasciculata]